MRAAKTWRSTAHNSPTQVCDTASWSAIPAGIAKGVTFPHRPGKLPSPVNKHYPHLRSVSTCCRSVHQELLFSLQDHRAWLIAPTRRLAPTAKHTDSPHSVSSSYLLLTCSLCRIMKATSIVLVCLLAAAGEHCEASLPHLADRASCLQAAALCSHLACDVPMPLAHALTWKGLCCRLRQRGPRC